MYYEIYLDKAGEWRWRLKSEKNEIIAVSGESYVDKVDCLRGISLVKGSRDTPVDDVLN